MGQKPRWTADWESEARFETLMKPIFQDEGGYVNDPVDRGGETNFGITAGTLKNYQTRYNRNFGENNQPISPKELKKEHGREIYRNEFFYGQRLHQINNPAITTILLDAAVMHGPQQSWKFMQKALNSIDGENALVVDGVGGSKTINKINNLTPTTISALIKEYTNFRRDSVDVRIEKDHTQKRFEKGWKSRIDRVMDRALGYVDRAPTG